jgi:hypothetical protein
MSNQDIDFNTHSRQKIVMAVDKMTLLRAVPTRAQTFPCKYPASQRASRWLALAWILLFGVASPGPWCSNRVARYKVETVHVLKPGNSAMTGCPSKPSPVAVQAA